MNKLVAAALAAGLATSGTFIAASAEPIVEPKPQTCEWVLSESL